LQTSDIRKICEAPGAVWGLRRRQQHLTTLHDEEPVKVTNIGREAQTLDASSQYLYGSGGQRFDADTEAALYLGVNQTRTFLEDINPGNSVNGILVYDIPKNEQPSKLELHDSPFSGGVTVEL
jgi:hypothetical protein